MSGQLLEEPALQKTRVGGVEEQQKKERTRRRRNRGPAGTEKKKGEGDEISVAEKADELDGVGEQLAGEAAALMAGAARASGGGVVREDGDGQRWE